MREYDNMRKSMEGRQINDFYEARRHIQSAMMGDTPVKIVQNRQYIDNVSDYDSEHHRIFKSVCHRQRHDENERANTNRRLALKDYTKPDKKSKYKDKRYQMMKILI